MVGQSRYCLVKDIVPGMQLAEEVVAENGKVVLRIGIFLTARQIAALAKWGIIAVRIIDPQDCEIKRHHKFCQEYEEIVKIVKSAFESVRYFKEVPLSRMRELVDYSINPLLDTIGLLNYLHRIRQKDEYTFQHSVNVAIIAGVLGKWLGYQGHELKNLILSGLLHDVGKTQVPLAILNKPGKLTAEEMNIVKRHTTDGYRLVKCASDLEHAVKLGVLQHHERLDGSGYPSRQMGADIHPYAKIIAIADIYDAITSDRSYRKRRTPLAAVEILVEQMFHQLDPDMCATFLFNVKAHFVGSAVLLNDGREGEIILLRGFPATKPIIKTRDGAVIDLSAQDEYRIIEFISTHISS